MQGFRNITICVNYKSHVIEDYFEDGSKFDLNIEYIKENTALGTAGALSLLNYAEGGGSKDSPFIVMNGDILSDVNFHKLINFHHEKHSMATMGVREFNYQIPYGVINTKNDKVTSIEEKPTQNFMVNAGIYCLNKECLQFIPKQSFFDMPDLFRSIIKHNNKIYAYLIEEYWVDIGRHEEYERANNESV